MKDFPIRPSSHVTESKSWKVLQKVIPDNWIIRDASKQDYGIDAYIELVTGKGEVRGDIVFVQLKGIEKGRIDWRKRDGSTYFDFPRIPIATVRYWMKLPVPVFLFVADVAAGRLWFANVEDQVHRRYDRFRKQKTFTFELLAENELGNVDGTIRFIVRYLIQRGHARFVTDLVSLLFNAQQFADFLSSHFGRDHFLTLEPDEFLTLYQMLTTCAYVALPLGLEWNVKSFSDLLKEDKKIWNTSGEIHELTIANNVPQIAEALSELLIAAQKHVMKTQQHYWRANHPVLHLAFSFNHLKYTFETLEDIRKAAKKKKKR